MRTNAFDNSSYQNQKITNRSTPALSPEIPGRMSFGKGLDKMSKKLDNRASEGMDYLHC